MPRYLFLVALLTFSGLLAFSGLLVDASSLLAEDSSAKLYSKENLIAWCIVPFDSEKRGPAERTEMLVRLGITKVAYDWRREHVATFEEEILEYQKHKIEFFAFWRWHPTIEPLIRKYGIHPQIWTTIPISEAASQEALIQASAEQLRSRVEKTKELGLQLGLYNHGKWGGEPENLVAVCQHLRKEYQTDHVGIVYNFHHGHGHIDDFADSLEKMLPYLLCININGMDDAVTVARGENKILSIGSGKHEEKMLRTIQASGYEGPIGIIDHRVTMDTEQCLHENIMGLQKLVANWEIEAE